jgi:hypothetical protein
MTDTEKKLADFFKGGGSEVMGAVVMWSLSGVHAPRAQLREDLEAIGLGAAVPKDPRPERLLGKAVEASRSGARGLVFRRKSKREWAVVEEAEVEGVLEMTHTITLGVEKNPADYFATMRPVRGSDGNHTDHPEPSKAAKALADRVVAQYEDAREFATTDDLSIILTQCMGGTTKTPLLGAVSLRQETGGVYFVPGCSVEAVQQLKAVVERVAPASHVTVLTLYGAQENLEEAAHAARQSFQAKLNELRGELTDFVAEMKAGEKEMTDRHVATRVSRLDTLQERVDMWKGALGDVQDELVEAIGAAKTEVAKAMGLD